MKDDREAAVKRSTTARPAKRAAPRAEPPAAESGAKPVRKRVNGGSSVAADAPSKPAAKRASSTRKTAAPTETGTGESVAKPRRRTTTRAAGPVEVAQPGVKEGRAASSAAQEPTPEERQLMIERIAYFRAEWRGWTPGAELDDWLHAEREVDAMLRGQRDG